MYINKKLLLAFAFVIFVGTVTLYWFVTSRGFSAREKPAWYERWIARHARRLASEPGARDLKNPLPTTPLNVAEARDHFADHCAICHANDGSGKTVIGQNMYPPAPDMRSGTTQELKDGELFYIIKNGIRFTGMPGWGGEDEENWKLVLFIRHLPQITRKELELMNEVNQLDSASESMNMQPHSEDKGSAHH